MIVKSKSVLSSIKVFGLRAGMAVGLLVVAVTSARATVIVQDTFEGSPCSISSWWRPDSQPKSTGGGNNGPEVGGAINSVAPHDGSCYTYHHYQGDEDSSILNSSWVQSDWPSTTIREWHSVYWIYIDSAHSGGSFLHPIHQKLGKWTLKTSWSGATSSCSTSNPCVIPNIAHVRGVAAGDTSVPMKWESSMETYGEVSDPPSACGTNAMGSSLVLTYNTWHKVETYTKLRGGCTGGLSSCAGCNDQHRVWIDDVLAVSGDNFNIDYTGSRVLTNFFFYGNASASGAPVDWWIYADGICVGTSYNDCTGAPFLGTKAQQTFGGGTTDTTAPAAVSNLAASGPTSSSVNLTWTAPGDDGNSGQASSYDIRYRTDAPLTASNWSTATQATGEPAPKVAGQAESFTVSGLSANTTYYFGLKTSDEVPNASAVSNSPTATTTTAAAGVTYLSDGFESGNLNNWTDDDGGFPGMAVTTSGPHAGTYANVQSFTTGSGGTYGSVFFADHPLLSSSDPQWTGVQESDVTLQWAAKFSPGFDPTTGSTKMFIMAAFESWSAPYPGPNSWSPYYTILQINQSGQPFLDHNRKVGTPGWTQMDQNQGTPVSVLGGAWHVIKARLKLNTPGLADGIAQMWIDGVLKASYSSVDFRGSYTSHGWNHLVLSSNMPNGAPATQQEYWDDILLTGAGSSSTAGPPATPQNLVRTDKH